MRIFGLGSGFCLLLACVPLLAAADPVPATGYVIDSVGTSLGPISRMTIAPSGFGIFGGDLFATVPSTFHVIRIEPDTGTSSVFATVAGIQAGFLEFAPGGAFGQDLYVSSNMNPTSTGHGLIERIDSTGSVTAFGDPTPPPGPQSYVFGGVGLDFSITGPFGTFLYSGASAGSKSDALSRIGSGGGASTLFADFGSELAGSPTELRFGPGGAFGTDLYVGVGVTGPAAVESGIYRYDAAGTRAAFSTVSTDPVMSGPILGMAFSPGGDFGTDLYACDDGNSILRIDSSGVAEAFVTAISSCGNLAFEADGSAMYFMEAGTETIWRVVASPSVPALQIGMRGLMVAGLMVAGLFTLLATRSTELRAMAGR